MPVAAKHDHRSSAAPHGANTRFEHRVPAIVRRCQMFPSDLEKYPLTWR
jgi:hypothetical protein